MMHFAKRLDWNLLKIFAAICESNGISRAAEELGRKQPAVSQALMRLESQLGVSLCRRGPSGFHLTPEGERLALECRDLALKIAALPRGGKDQSSGLTGLVRLGIVNSLISTAFDDSIMSFHRNFPSIELSVEVLSWEQIVSALLQEKIDVGISPAKLKADKIDFRRFFSEEYQLYCGRLQRLFGVTVDDPATLQGEPFILTGTEEPDKVTEFREKYGLGGRSMGSSPHLDEAKRLAMLGVGLCFLPKNLASPEVETNRLWPILGNTESLIMEIFLLTNRTSSNNLPCKLFLGEFTPEVREAAE